MVGSDKYDQKKKGIAHSYTNDIFYFQEKLMN